MDAPHYTAKCQAELHNAVSMLGGDAASPRLAGMAELIIQSMTGPWRSFHTPEHIFDVGAGGAPVEVIAALFHDLVYAQVDSGIHVNLARYVAPYIREGATGLVIEPVQGQEQDPELQMTMGLFGFKLGQVLSPFAGQNEFLSALLAVKVLDGILPLAARAQIAACIEATVPFRPDAPDGTSCSQTLLQRLKQANTDFALGMDDAACLQAVVMGVKVANRDIGNFASLKAADFLSNTWNLIPETNHELVNADTYTIKGYRVSLQKMEGFLSFLQPAVVFRQFAQEPSDLEHQLRLELTQRNLEVARLYIRLKLVSIAMLEAFSLRLGQQVSLATIMGKLPGKTIFPIQLENYLPTVKSPYKPASTIEETVMDILETGRSEDSIHDARHSPVASYLVKSLGMQACMHLLEQSRLYFADKLSPEELIASADSTVIQGLEHAVYSVFHHHAQAFVAH
ncbi:MAG: hypothetical protein RLZZ239_1137 [Pseudomonadota bacterium]